MMLLAWDKGNMLVGLPHGMAGSFSYCAVRNSGAIVVMPILVDVFTRTIEPLSSTILWGEVSEELPPKSITLPTSVIIAHL
jgi:hypothetical protein